MRLHYSCIVVQILHLLSYCAQGKAVNTVMSAPCSSVSFRDFMNLSRQRLKEFNFEAFPRNSDCILEVFIGNEACDADSIISSCCFAWLDSVRHVKERGALPSLFLPVVCISREELELRSETMFLFRRLGIKSTALLTLNEVEDMVSLAAKKGHLR